MRRGLSSPRWMTSVASCCGLQRRADLDVEGLVAVDAERLPRVARLELQRQHAHADQVRAVDALEALRDHRLDAEQLRALGGPVAARAGAVLLAAEDDRRRALGHVLHRRVVDEHLLARGLEQRHAAFLARAVGAGRDHQVLDAHVGEGAAHHHVVVAAARAVGVEVGLGDAVLLQPDAGRRRLLDRAGGRDVVGGDRVAEQRHRARALDRRGRRRRLHLEALEERRLGDVGRRRPVVDLAGDAADLLPQRPGLARDLVVVAPCRPCRSSRTSSAPRSRRWSARCRRARRPCRPCPCRPARSSGRAAPCRRSRRRRRAAGWRGSSPSGSGGCAPRSCGCPKAPRRRRGRSW